MLQSVVCFQWSFQLKVSFYYVLCTVKQIFEIVSDFNILSFGLFLKNYLAGK